MKICRLKAPFKVENNVFICTYIIVKKTDLDESVGEKIVNFNAIFKYKKSFNVAVKILFNDFSQKIFKSIFYSKHSSHHAVTLFVFRLRKFLIFGVITLP